MNLLTRIDSENEMATRNTTTAIGVGGGSSSSSTKPVSHGSHNIPAHLEPDGERIQPGHTLNALHDDVFSPPRRLDTSASSVTDDDGDDTDNRGDSRGHTGPESPKKKKKSAHHLHMPHVSHLHVPHFKVGKKHQADAHGKTNGSDPLSTAEHHRDTSSTARIEQTISKEESPSGSAKADEDRQDAKVVASSDPDRDVSELSTSQISSHSAQPFGGRPPPPSAEPSSTSLRSSSTNSTGVRPSNPRDHGIYSLLHSPILTKSTKVIGKLAHAPHLPHIPELPHIHLYANRGPSVEDSLAALDLEDTSITSILEHMGKHAANVRVQERGCARLTRLAKEKDNMQEITEAGGIEIILDAIRRCSDDTELIAQAFSALGNLAALDTANKQKIAHLNGIETIISAMLAHSYDPVLQERACGLLFNLSFDHTVSEASLRATSASIGYYSAEAKVHFRIYSPPTSRSNLYEPNQNKELIAEHHGLEAIIEAMKHFPAYPNLQHNACEYGPSTPSVWCRHSKLSFFLRIFISHHHIIQFWCSDTFRLCPMESWRFRR